MFSIGAFFKRIINPIEFSLETTQPAIRTFSYQNEKSAEIRGIELEVRKNLDFAGRLFARQFFKYLSFYGNFSLIQSSVQFKPQSTGAPGRSLQGQSPFVVNASLFYENPKGWNASVNFNKLGSRIAYIGVAKEIQPYGTDIYEFGRSVLDIQLGKNFKRLGNFKITVGDLLRQNSVFFQDLNNDRRYTESVDNTLFKFTIGSTVTVGYSYTF
jgi:outer membrane receptor protein involved in Fe transport